MTRSLPPREDGSGEDHGSGTPPEPQGSLRPTDLRAVIVAALCGAVLAWFILSIFVITDVMVPVLTWSLPIILGIVAVGVWVDSRILRRKVLDHHREVSPTEGLVSLALGKALVLTGFALAGACVVYVLNFIRQLSIPYPRQRVITGTVTALVCLGLGLAGWALERACRVPPDDGPDPRNGVDRSPDGDLGRSAH